MKKSTSLFLLILLLLSTISFGQKKGKNVPPPPPPVAPKLDVYNNSEDALKADRKITSSLKDGEECVYWWEGHVYSRIAGEKDRLLFNYVGMNVRASKTVKDSVKGYGWRHVSRELLFYQDPKTNEILRMWDNPITGEKVEVIHVANDPVNGRGATFAKGPTPYKFKMMEKEGFFMQTSEVPLFYTNPLQGEYQEYIGGTYHAMEVFNTIVSKDDLLDATKDKADDVIIAWSRMSKFLPWMKMGDRAGWAIFTGTGKKLRGGTDALPEVMKEEMRKNYPEYFHAPSVDDTRPNETSWTVFKKHMEKKKAAKTN
jgi:hypothetical protein